METIEIIFEIYCYIILFWMIIMILLSRINNKLFKDIVGLKPNDPINSSDVILMGLLSCVFWPIFIPLTWYSYKAKKN